MKTYLDKVTRFFKSLLWHQATGALDTVPRVSWPLAHPQRANELGRDDTTWHMVCYSHIQNRRERKHIKNDGQKHCFPLTIHTWNKTKTPFHHTGLSIPARRSFKSTRSKTPLNLASHGELKTRSKGRAYGLVTLTLDAREETQKKSLKTLRKYYILVRPEIKK